MNIQLNGKQREISSGTCITDLLKELDMADTSVVAVLNQTVLQTEEFEDKHLQEGDTLELIRFVGGGC